MRQRIVKGLRGLADRLERPSVPPPRKSLGARDSLGTRDFTVVVSGAPFLLRMQPHHTVADLMRKALEEAGIVPRPRRGECVVADLPFWDLRKKSGKMVASMANEGKGSCRRIGEAGLQHGETLFLDPEEGGGG